MHSRRKKKTKSFCSLSAYTIESSTYCSMDCFIRGEGLETEMKKILGFVLFWISVGMLLMFFMDNRLLGIIIGAVFLLVGYNLFCS